MSMEMPTIRFIKGAAEIIDQVLLPATCAVRRLQTVEAVCEAIETLRIRGAPALGIAAPNGGGAPTVQIQGQDAPAGRLAEQAIVVPPGDVAGAEAEVVFRGMLRG